LPLVIELAFASRNQLSNALTIWYFTIVTEREQ
jgi:hypothetical protein